MKKSVYGFLIFILVANAIHSEELPVQYEELNTPQFVQAVKLSGGTVVIPLGILEKHGPHLPLGTDLIDVRETVLRAVHTEYSVVFPPYYFGQIYEAKHQPGVIAYSPELVWNVLQETCDELGRNGFRKIILVSGHGGNNNFLPYFCQSQLAKQKDYAVILFNPTSDPEVEKQIESLRQTQMDGHAGEAETSMIMAHRPDLAHPERGGEQSGEDQNRLEGIPYSYTAIWWYAKFPNHYAGDGSKANPEIGNLILNEEAEQLAELIRVLKADDRILELQQQFYRQSSEPLNTAQ
jgi:creatinine amidohydrolase